MLSPIQRIYNEKWMFFPTFCPPVPYPLGKDFITERTVSSSMNKGSLSSFPPLLLAASICASDLALSSPLVMTAARTQIFALGARSAQSSHLMHIARTAGRTEEKE